MAADRYGITASRAGRMRYAPARAGSAFPVYLTAAASSDLTSSMERVLMRSTVLAWSHGAQVISSHASSINMARAL